MFLYQIAVTHGNLIDFRSRQALDKFCTSCKLIESFYFLNSYIHLKTCCVVVAENRLKVKAGIGMMHFSMTYDWC